ncbi:MAG: pyridoxal phosphate-dependent aminotransferase [Hyphomicrobiales bacterium]
MVNQPSSSARSALIKPFIAMDMLREANAREASGGDVIHMEVGQPSSRPPRKVIEAAKQTLDVDRIGYTNALGIPALRERIAQHYKDTYDLNVPAERVVVTTGSSGGFVLAFLAAFEAGGSLALPVPGYPAYKNLLSALGLEMVEIETGPSSRWAPDPADIAAMAGDIDGVLIASPNNPTGTMLSPDALRQVCDVCAKSGLWFISDEIYHGLTFGMKQASALQFSDDAIVINSFSKYFCMTGWRIGWMVVPERLLRTVECLSQSIFISSPTLSQHAAIAAFDAVEETEALKAVYARNRELLLNEMPKAGFTEFTPVDGAFYIYADVSRFTNDSYAFAEKMLRETGVATTPGADFDNARGNSFLRFSFAGSTPDMQEAVNRLKAWLA